MRFPRVTIFRLCALTAIIAFNLGLLRFVLEGNLEDTGREGSGFLLLALQLGFGLAWMKPGPMRRFGFGLAAFALVSFGLLEVSLTYFPDHFWVSRDRFEEFAISAIERGFERMPQMVRDFDGGGTLIEQLPFPLLGDVLFGLPWVLPSLIVGLVAAGLPIRKSARASALDSSPRTHASVAN